MRRFTFGDIHGEYEKLVELFEIAPIKEGDVIIQLGDVVDRGKDTYKCVEFLLSLKDKYQCHFLKGNHDDEFYQALKENRPLKLFSQGAKETLESYIRDYAPEKKYLMTSPYTYTSNFKHSDLPKSHIEFFENQKPFYILDNMCFVHGGFNRHLPIEGQDDFVLLWDRDLLMSARSYAFSTIGTSTVGRFKIKDGFDKIFIGHTPVQAFGETTPQKYGPIWAIDTGSGKGGVLTLMDIDTEEYWQSK